MTDTPMTPEELADAAMVAQRRGALDPELTPERCDEVCRALLQEHARAEALAARVAELEPENAALTERWRLRELAHCNDCCCARVWEALGVTVMNGRDLAENVTDLRADARRWRAVQESARSTTVSWGGTDPAHSGSRTEWQITAWLHGDTIDEAADRLADPEGS